MNEITKKHLLGLEQLLSKKSRSDLNSIRYGATRYIKDNLTQVDLNDINTLLFIHQQAWPKAPAPGLSLVHRHGGSPSRSFLQLAIIFVVVLAMVTYARQARRSRKTKRNSKPPEPPREPPEPTESKSAFVDIATDPSYKLDNARERIINNGPISVESAYSPMVALPNGNIAVVCYYDRDLRANHHYIGILDIKNGTLIRKLKRTKRVTALALMPDGHLAAGYQHGKIRVWNPISGNLISTTQSTAEIQKLAAMPDGRLASLTRNVHINIWNTGNFAPLHEIIHPDRVDSLIAMPSGKLVTGSLLGMVRIWNPSFALKYTLVGHTGLVNNLVALPNDRLASGSHDSTMRIWCTHTGICLFTLNVPGLTAMVRLPSGKLAAGCIGGFVCVWNPDNGRQGGRIKTRLDIMRVMVVSKRTLVMGYAQPTNHISVLEI